MSPDVRAAGGLQRDPSFGKLQQQLRSSQRTYSFDWCSQDPSPEPDAAFEEGEEEHISLGAARDASLDSTAFGTALGGVAADMRRALDAIRAARRSRPNNGGHLMA